MYGGNIEVDIADQNGNNIRLPTAISSKEASKEAVKYKKKGFNFKVEMWIHAGDDDKQMVAYFTEKPTDAAIQAILKKKKSRVTTDYRIEAL